MSIRRPDVRVGALCGLRVAKLFPHPQTEGNDAGTVPALFLGTVVDYHSYWVPRVAQSSKCGGKPLEQGLYRVKFDDGRVEDVPPDEVLNYAMVYHKEQQSRQAQKSTQTSITQIFSTTKGSSDANEKLGLLILKSHVNQPLSVNSLSKLNQERLGYWNNNGTSSCGEPAPLTKEDILLWWNFRHNYKQDPIEPCGESFARPSRQAGYQKAHVLDTTARRNEAMVTFKSFEKGCFESDKSHTLKSGSSGNDHIDVNDLSEMSDCHANDELPREGARNTTSALSDKEWTVPATHLMDGLKGSQTESVSTTTHGGTRVSEAIGRDDHRLTNFQSVLTNNQSSADETNKEKADASAGIWDRATTPKSCNKPPCEEGEAISMFRIPNQQEDGQFTISSPPVAESGLDMNDQLSGEVKDGKISSNKRRLSETDTDAERDCQGPQRMKKNPERSSPVGDSLKSQRSDASKLNGSCSCEETPGESEAEALRALRVEARPRSQESRPSTPSSIIQVNERQGFMNIDDIPHDEVLRADDGECSIESHGSLLSFNSSFDNLPQTPIPHHSHMQAPTFGHGDASSSQGDMMDLIPVHPTENGLLNQIDSRVESDDEKLPGAQSGISHMTVGEQYSAGTSRVEGPRNGDPVDGQVPYRPLAFRYHGNREAASVSQSLETGEPIPDEKWELLKRGNTGGEESMKNSAGVLLFPSQSERKDCPLDSQPSGSSADSFPRRQNTARGLSWQPQALMPDLSHFAVSNDNHEVSTRSDASASSLPKPIDPHRMQGPNSVRQPEGLTVETTSQHRRQLAGRTGATSEFPQLSVSQDVQFQPVFDNQSSLQIERLPEAVQKWLAENTNSSQQVSEHQRNQGSHSESIPVMRRDSQPVVGRQPQPHGSVHQPSPHSELFERRRSQLNCWKQQTAQGTASVHTRPSSRSQNERNVFQLPKPQVDAASDRSYKIVEIGHPQREVVEGRFYSRHELYLWGAHRSDISAVNGTPDDGCDSLLVYKASDDLDRKDDLVMFKHKCSRRNGGQALFINQTRNLPARVFRTMNRGDQYFRYDGLYSIIAMFDELGNPRFELPSLSIHQVEFLFKRNPVLSEGLSRRGGPSPGFFNQLGIDELLKCVQLGNEQRHLSRRRVTPGGLSQTLGLASPPTPVDEARPVLPENYDSRGIAVQATSRRAEKPHEPDASNQREGQTVAPRPASLPPKKSAEVALLHIRYYSDDESPEENDTSLARQNEKPRRPMHWPSDGCRDGPGAMSSALDRFFGPDRYDDLSSTEMSLKTATWRVGDRELEEPDGDRRGKLFDPSS